MSRTEIEPADSSSGEEEEVSFEGSESESEPDKTSTPPPFSKKTQLVPKSSSDESDSESDPDNLPVPDPSIKPLSSKPMDVNSAKKSRSKNPTSLYSPHPFNQSTGKRAPAVGDGVDGSDAKRVKKATVVAVAAPDAETGGEKKQLFQRLWSEENEIELIQGMIDYVEQKGKDPVADVNEFHEFVKESLHVDVNNRQVLTKARRLKKKFENNVAKVEKDGKVRSFSNPHEKKMYELSKNLWGSDSNNNVVMSSSSKKVNVKANVTPKTNKSREMVSLGNGNGGIEVVKPKLVSGNVFDPFTEEFIMSKGLEKLSGAEKVEMEEKWKDFKVQELEFFVKKVELLKMQAEFVLNAITKSAGAK